MKLCVFLACDAETVSAARPPKRVVWRKLCEAGACLWRNEEPSDVGCGLGGEEPTGTMSLGLCSGDENASEGKSSSSRAKASSLSKSLTNLSGVLGSVGISGLGSRLGAENDGGLGTACGVGTSILGFL
jgi:hypothetical protein